MVISLLLLLFRIVHCIYLFQIRFYFIESQRAAIMRRQYFKPEKILCNNIGK